MEYDVVIGLEIHVQLKTKSKMFCPSSSVYFGTSPNSHVCPTCLGLPGALPVTNKKAIENAIKVGLALNCKINKFNKFDRKSYFYPDLPKGFQISQYDLPVSQNGFVLVNNRKIRINRAHQEEDTGKLIHQNLNGESVSLIDYNRSGVPLIEIVSEPDINSAEEAKMYAKKIHQLVRYIGVADVDMEKAGMRFDANVSIKPKGSKEFGTKVEIKNINSFTYLEKAIEFEVNRQKEVLSQGGKIIQETRGWVETKGETVSQRTKETSPDYRYFPDPDLPPLEFSDEEIDKLASELPELPDQKGARFIKNYSLTEYEANLLSEDRNIADWFEKVVEIYAKEQKDKETRAKKVSNWVQGELLRFLNETGKQVNEIKAEPAHLAQLLILLDQEEINNQAAKQVFARCLETGELPFKIIEELGLKQVSGPGELEKVVEETIAENTSAVDDFKKGKESSMQFLIGMVMRKTQGKANVSVVTEILKNKLK